MEPKVKGQCVDRNRIRTEKTKFQLFSIHLAVVQHQLAVTITTQCSAMESASFKRTALHIVQYYTDTQKDRTIRILPF